MAGKTARGAAEEPAKLLTGSSPGEASVGRLADGATKEPADLHQKTSPCAAAAISESGES